MWEDLIRRYSAVYNVPESWVYGVIKTESGGNANAYNPSDPSYGLMGLMLPTARDMGYAGTAQGLFDPDANIKYGTKYLAWIRDRWETVNPAEIYSAFNSGRPGTYRTSAEVAGNVNRFLGFASEWGPVAGVGIGTGLLLVFSLLGFRKRRK